MKYYLAITLMLLFSVGSFSGESDFRKRIQERRDRKAPPKTILPSNCSLLDKLRYIAGYYPAPYESYLKAKDLHRSLTGGNYDIASDHVRAPLRKKIYKAWSDYTRSMNLMKSEDQYDIIPMAEYAYGESRGLTEVGSKLKPFYFSKGKLNDVKVEVREGIVYQKGEPLNCTYCIYVMDRDGNIYIEQDVQGAIHHSSFFKGEPVASAGHITVTNGVIKYISNKSGHYAPTIEQGRQVLTELSRRGIDLIGDILEFRSARSWIHGPEAIPERPVQMTE